MYKGRFLSLILLMAGEGERFNSDVPKQFHRLAGKKVYLRSLEVFLSLKIFDEILLVCHKNWINIVKKEISLPSVHVIEGGKTRQESSFLGLKALHFHDIVMIHDAVRPFVTTSIIEKNIDFAIEIGAVDTCIPSADTLVKVNDSQEIVAIPLRKELLRGQTPQTFSYHLIMEAHEKALFSNATDDCSLILKLSHKVKVVMGDESNIKITTPLDLFLAEQLLRIQTKRISSEKNTSLKKKKYIVIGGSGGIGEALCELIKKEGAKVFSISRTTKPYQMDLRNPKSMEDLFEVLHKKERDFDGIIFASGILQVKPLIETSYEEMEEIIRTNLIGVIYSCKLAKIKAKGHIITLASSSFSRGRKNYGIYSASKAALVNFTQSLAEEFSHLLVNSIVPSRTNTSMRRKNFIGKDLVDLLSPDEVALEIVNLLKDTSTTGSIIEVKKK